MKKRILIVDDDVSIGNMLEELLRGEGYDISRAYSGTEALLFLEKAEVDLILLDLMLPGLCGEEVLKKTGDVPVIVVSAKPDVGNKVKLLLGGAADYVTKPFDTQELLARIAVQLRQRGHHDTAPMLTAGELSLQVATHEATVQGRCLHLTRTEYAILKLLMQNSGQVLTKSVILEGIFADTPDCTESSLKQHISNLRRKLREAGGREYIEAVWGIGFRLADKS